MNAIPMTATVESTDRAAKRCNLLPHIANLVANRDLGTCNDVVQLLQDRYDNSPNGSCCKPWTEPLWDDEFVEPEWQYACTHVRSLQHARSYQELARAKAPTNNAYPCSCNGRGTVSFGGAVVNGVFTGTTGTCYRCGGKGWQTKGDVKRNTYYDAHIRRIPA